MGYYPFYGQTRMDYMTPPTPYDYMGYPVGFGQSFMPFPPMPYYSMYNGSMPYFMDNTNLYYNAINY